MQPMQGIMTMFTDRSSFPDHNDTLAEVPTSNRITGVAYFLFSLLCLVPYLICLWCIVSDQNLRKKPSYIIVLHIGIADIVQLIFNGMCCGVFTFFGTDFGFWTNKVMGGIMNVGWIVYTTLAHVLSFNRFIALCKPHLKERWFSKDATNRAMAICWIYGLVWLIVYMCPQCSVIFDLVYRNWNYDQRYLASQILWLLELIQDTCHFLLSIVWYAFSFAAVRKSANQISDVQINQNRKELQLLLQAVCICAMIGLTLIGFFAVPLVFSQDPWSTTACNFIWLTCCGSNFAIYMKFNKAIRHRVIAKVQFWKWNQTSVNAPATSHRAQPRSQRQAITPQIDRPRSLPEAIDGPVGAVPGVLTGHDLHPEHINYKFGKHKDTKDVGSMNKK